MTKRGLLLSGLLLALSPFTIQVAGFTLYYSLFGYGLFLTAIIMGERPPLISRMLLPLVLYTGITNQFFFYFVFQMLFWTVLAYQRATHTLALSARISALTALAVYGLLYPLAAGYIFRFPVPLHLLNLLSFLGSLSVVLSFLIDLPIVTTAFAKIYKKIFKKS